MEECKHIEMEVGKIYFISFGGNTQLVARYKESDTYNYLFFDLLHYWNGFETFRRGIDSCAKSGITEMRPATKPEKHALIRHEIEYDCI